MKAPPGSRAPSLARATRCSVYDDGRAEQAEGGRRRRRAILAEDSNDAASYLRLVHTRRARGTRARPTWPAQKAVDLAPKAQQKQVKKQVEAAARSAAHAAAAERLTYPHAQQPSRERTNQGEA